MKDPRMTRLAELLVRHSTRLQPGENVLIEAFDIPPDCTAELIRVAQEAGATDAQLEEARYLQRRATLRWDFVHSENSTGFHSPQEAARILADAINYARQSQISAERAAAQPEATAQQ